MEQIKTMIMQNPEFYAGIAVIIALLLFLIVVISHLSRAKQKQNEPDLEDDDYAYDEDYEGDVSYEDDKFLHASSDEDLLPTPDEEGYEDDYEMHPDDGVDDIENLANKFSSAQDFDEDINMTDIADVTDPSEANLDEAEDAQAPKNDDDDGKLAHAAMPVLMKTDSYQNEAAQNALNEKISATNEKILSLEAKLADLARERIRAQSERDAEIQQENARKISDMEAKLMSLELEKSRLEAQARAEDEKDDIIQQENMKKIAILESKLVDLEREKSRLEMYSRAEDEKTTVLQKESARRTAELEAKIADLEREKSRLESSQHSGTQKERTLEIRLATLEVEKKMLEEIRNAESEKVKSLQEQLAALSNRAVAPDRAVENSLDDARIAALEARLTSLITQSLPSKSDETKIADLEAKLSALLAQKEEQGKISALEAQLAVLVGEKNITNSEKADRQNEQLSLQLRAQARELEEKSRRLEAALARQVQSDIAFATQAVNERKGRDIAPHIDDDANHGSGDNIDRIIEIEHKMRALRDQYHAGEISSETYLVKSRNYARAIDDL